MIVALKSNEVFVFGSNEAGRHGAGAALQARRKFGAEYGVGEGLTGQCYAFPTLDGSLHRRSRVQLLASRDRLYEVCEANPGKSFLLTKVGCGLAGFAEADMRAMFALPPKNLVLPEDWR